MLNFVSEARSFGDAVALAARAAADRDVVPALTGVLVRGEGHELIFSATDLQVGISLRITADVRSEGSMLLPARRLQELLRHVPAEELVEVRAIEGTASLRFGRARFDLVTLPVLEYPEVSLASPEDVVARVPTKALRRALQLVSYAVSTRDDSLPVLLGIHVHIQGSVMEVAASDNFRLAWCRLEGVEGPEEPLDLIVRGRTLSEFVRMVETETVGMAVDERRLHLFLEGVQAFAQRIEGTFPDHRQLLQREFVTKFTFSVPKLLAACERAQLVSNAQSPQVLLTLTAGEPLALTAGTADLGQAQEEVEGTVEGQALEVAFNPRYLIEALRNLAADEAVLSFSGATSAATLVPKEHPEDQLAILLPLRLW
jgi:DNA polymerase-3 subunit beta